MRPPTRNIAVTRGDDYQHLVTFTDAAGLPVDVTGRTYTAQIRAGTESPAVLATFTCAIATPPEDGAVWVTLDDADTAGLTPGRRAWDLQEDNAGVITTVLAGWCDVVGDVTREEEP